MYFISTLTLLILSNVLFASNASFNSIIIPGGNTNQNEMQRNRDQGVIEDKFFDNVTSFSSLNLYFQNDCQHHNDKDNKLIESIYYQAFQAYEMNNHPTFAEKIWCFFVQTGLEKTEKNAQSFIDILRLEGNAEKAWKATQSFLFFNTLGAKIKNMRKDIGQTLGGSDNEQEEI